MPRYQALLILLLLTCSAAGAAEPRVQTEVFGAPAPDGQGYLLALELRPEAGWHSYWKNPGDAGLPAQWTWTLPGGVREGERLWPAPKAYPEDDLLTYGYGEPYVLLTRIRAEHPPADDELVQLEARWLVCKDICIPESARHELPWREVRQTSDAEQARLHRALARIPEPLPERQGRFASSDEQVRSFLPLDAAWLDGAERLHWFPAARNLVNHAGEVRWSRTDAGLVIEQPRHPDRQAPPEHSSGVLVIEQGGTARAVELPLVAGEVPPAGEPLAAGGARTTLGIGLVLLMAFAGGLILNLMPCVFPVLALKALALTRAESAQARRSESLAYAAGVVFSFLLIAGLLLALRAGGAALGWGFQLQNPVVVGVLAVLMFLLALAMADWTQIGMGMMGWGQNLTGGNGHRGAFFTGVLAVVVASPCTAPFMGTALGYAIVQPPAVALSVFTSLGLGLAAPFVLIAWVPALARRLPRPGPWMQRLKHWLALPLALTGVWLLWVLHRQAGDLALAAVIASVVLLAIASRQSVRGRWLARGPAVSVSIVALALLAAPAWLDSDRPAARTEGWSDWSPATITAAQARGQMVFVDFTADWCLSCKVNERTALANTKVRERFAAHDVLLVKADWTEHDPAITAALAEFDRNGVPLYLLYPADGGPPEVLPQLLTPGLLLAAVERAATKQAAR